MASGMTSGKRFAVRLSLVTSSTMAMIIGAQSLATLNQVNAAPVDNIVSVPVVQVTPIVHAAPSITIIRRAGTTTTASANTSGTTTAAPTTTSDSSAIMAGRGEAEARDRRDASGRGGHAPRRLAAGPAASSGSTLRRLATARAWIASSPAQRKKPPNRPGWSVRRPGSIGDRHSLRPLRPWRAGGVGADQRRVTAVTSCRPRCR